MTNRHIVDRNLPDRSKLVFYFPMPSEGDNYYTVELPFFENISIKETKRAKYKKYSLISRSSNLYSYLGADSRNLNLTFNISLPHLLEEPGDMNLDKYVSYTLDKTNREAEKERFKKPYKAKTNPDGVAMKMGTEYTKSLAQDSAQQVLDILTSKGGTPNQETLAYISNRYGLGQVATDTAVAQETTVLGKIGAFLGNQVDRLQNASGDYLKARGIDLVVYWINIIRSSVVNYAKNPIYGPPVIRLNHGVMYQNIPCICTSYSIDLNEAAGYDLDTLLPRQIKVTMKLEEFRTGDFGEFMPKGNPIERDNLAGWEAVILGESNSMDPGNAPTAPSPARLPFSRRRGF